MCKEITELYCVTIVTLVVILFTVLGNLYDRPELNDVCKIVVGGYIGYVGRNSIGTKDE